MASAPDGTRAALEGGTASWLADRLSDLSREIGSTANGAHCYGVWARRLSWLSAYAAALAASPAPAPTTEELDAILTKHEAATSAQAIALFMDVCQWRDKLAGTPYGLAEHFDNQEDIDYSGGGR